MLRKSYVWSMFSADFFFMLQHKEKISRKHRSDITFPQHTWSFGLPNGMVISPWMLIIGFYHNYNYIKKQQSAYTIYWDCPKGSLGDSYWIYAVKDFLFELGMKPHTYTTNTHFVKISIFSLNNVTVWLTKSWWAKNSTLQFERNY